MSRRVGAFERPAFPIAPIVEALASEPCRVTYKGGWSHMRCPFHPDRNPSASINHEANRFHCFTCGIQYEDGIGLIQHVEGADYASAVSEAERITGQSHDTLRGKRALPRLNLFS